MSDSMPVMTNAAAGGAAKEMLATAQAGESGAAAEGSGFTELLDAQLDELAQADGSPPSPVNAFPEELLRIGDDSELLTSVPASGNPLPLTPAMPVPAVTATADAGLAQAAVTGPQAKPAGARGPDANPGLQPAPLATGAVEADSAMQDMLSARQQDALLRTQAASRKEAGALPDTLLNSSALPDSTSQPASAGNFHNSLNLAALSAAGAGRGDASVATPAAVTVPPQHPGWGQAVGDRLQWMVSQNLQTADIRLDPPELGSMEVHIQIGKDHHASIAFSAASHQVREALESAIPRLREMMNEVGVSLGDVNVSQESFAHRQQADEGPAGNRPAVADEEAGVEPLAGANIPLRRGQGLLDAYA